jgi:hypothetical protein
VKRAPEKKTIAAKQPKPELPKTRAAAFPKKTKAPTAPPATITESPRSAPRRPRMTAAERKAATSVVYVARGGSLRGAADYEVPFASRPQALAFLVNQHGLTIEEQRKLAKSSTLRLNRRWHGSDACAIKEMRMTPDEAQRALATGEAASA